MILHNFLITGINPEPWTAPEGSAGRAKNGKLFVKFYKQETLRAYQEALAEQFARVLEQQGVGTCYYKSPIPLRLEFYFWRQIESWEAEGKRAGQANIADVTNLQKSTEDALQGLLFENDRQVQQVQSYIMLQDTSADPMILIRAGICDFTKLDMILDMVKNLTPTVEKTDSNVRPNIPDTIF